MPEPPDFDQIARDIVKRTRAPLIYQTDAVGTQLTLVGTVTSSQCAFADGPSVEQIAEQLRQVWNARGAADADALERIGQFLDRRAEISALLKLDR